MPVIQIIEQFVKLNYPDIFQFLSLLPLKQSHRVGIWPQATFLYKASKFNKHKDKNNLLNFLQFTLVFGNFCGGELDFSANSEVISFQNSPPLVIFNAKEQEHQVFPTLGGYRFSLQLFVHQCTMNAFKKK